MILPGLAFGFIASAGFGPARAWTVGFTDSNQIPLFADVDGDGTPDLITVNPAGDGSIDVDLTALGSKPAGASRALEKWGKGCQAAVAAIVPGATKASVFGIFEGQTLSVASDFANGHFKLSPAWCSLPTTLDHPCLGLLNGGKTILAFSTDTGEGFQIDSISKAVVRCSVPKGLVWFGDAGQRFAGQRVSGEVDWIDKTKLRFAGKIGVESKGSRPAVFDGGVIFGDKQYTAEGSVPLSPAPYPPADITWAASPLPSGKWMSVEFRNGDEFHKGNLVLARLPVGSESESSSNDGLLDDWKRKGFRGLDLKGLGCTVGHADVICLVSRFDDVTQDRLTSQMKRVIQFYEDLPCKNPDGTTGIRFHPIYLDPITGADKNNGWQTNRDKFLPEKWRGVVHWMQVTPGGGGQADELSNGGTCGQNSLWEVFVHEFGHQLGLNHEGFWPVNGSPIYTSLMNYTWSYGFEEDRNKIHYSNDEFKGLVLRENDLDETLPYPFAKVKFLSMAPYHFRLQPKGDQTLIDWNWDGVFGEKHVKANITYSYSIQAGTRDNVGKTKTAPWIFLHDRNAFALYGTNDAPVDLKRQPTLDETNPGRLVLKRLESPNHWSKEWVVDSKGLIGDPVAVSFRGGIVCCYPSDRGLLIRKISGATASTPIMVSTDRSLVPSIGVYQGRCLLFDWNPKTHEVGYQAVNPNGKVGERHLLDVSSSNPVGFCTDTVHRQLILALAQDQSKDKTNRWQVRRYTLNRIGSLEAEGGPSWVEGVDGGAKGTGRLTILFDGGRDAGPKGRLLLFGKGITDEKTPWACSYVAQTISDQT
jgi:hypothetical protein